jgi:hypothetical protein
MEAFIFLCADARRLLGVVDRVAGRGVEVVLWPVDVELERDTLVEDEVDKADNGLLALGLGVGVKGTRALDAGVPAKDIVASDASNYAKWAIAIERSEELLVGVRERLLVGVMVEPGVCAKQK